MKEDDKRENMDININNYEEYLLCYLDGELNADEETAFRKFMAQHPKVQKEWQLLQATKIPVEHDIIFPDKKSLYKQEAKPKEKIFLLRHYKWIAAAACAALLIVFYLQFQKRNIPAQKMAVNKSTQVSDLKTNQATSTSSATSPALAITKKKNIEPQKANTNKVLAAGSTKKNAQVQSVKRSISKNISLQQEENKKTAANNAPSQLLSLPSLPITQEKSAIKVAVVSSDKEIISTNEAAKQPTERPKLLAKNTSTENISLDHKITHVATSFASAKEEMDSTITQKLTDFNQKTSGFISKIAKNGIKIGHVTFAFNN